MICSGMAISKINNAGALVNICGNLAIYILLILGCIYLTLEAVYIFKGRKLLRSKQFIR